MRTSWMTCLCLLGLGAGACSDDAPGTGPHDASSGADARFTTLDAGPFPIDAGNVTTSVCEQADSRFSSALGSDAILAQLAACTQDTDCVLWNVSISCANGGVNSQCPRATHVANVLQAEARRDVVASGTYCAPGEPVCRGGASCAPLAARCIQRLCTALIAWPDAGR